MDIYKEVTDRIIAQMENGIIPWQKPWSSSGLASAMRRAKHTAFSIKFCWVALASMSPSNECSRRVARSRRKKGKHGRVLKVD